MGPSVLKSKLLLLFYLWSKTNARHFTLDDLPKSNPFDWLVPQPTQRSLQNQNQITSNSNLNSNQITTSKPVNYQKWPTDYKCPYKCLCENETLSITCSGITEKFRMNDLSPLTRNFHITNSTYKYRLNTFGSNIFTQMLNFTISNTTIWAFNGRLVSATPNLKHFSWYKTKITSITSIPKSVAYASFAKNNISSLSFKRLSDMKSLVSLDLSGNNANTYRDRIKTKMWLPRLKFIDFSFNNLTFISDQLKIPPFLERLDYSHNRLLSAYPQSYSSRFPNLRYLNLSSNLIKYLESRIFYVYPKLTELNIKNNQIVKFDSVFSKLVKTSSMYYFRKFQFDHGDCSSCQNLFQLKMLLNLDYLEIEVDPVCRDMLDSASFTVDEVTGRSTCEFEVLPSTTTTTTITTTTTTSSIPIIIVPENSTTTELPVIIEFNNKTINITETISEIRPHLINTTQTTFIAEKMTSSIPPTVSSVVTNHSLTKPTDIKTPTLKASLICSPKFYPIQSDLKENFIFYNESYEDRACAYLKPFITQKEGFCGRQSVGLKTLNRDGTILLFNHLKTKKPGRTDNNRCIDESLGRINFNKYPFFCFAYKGYFLNMEEEKSESHNNDKNNPSKTNRTSYISVNYSYKIGKHEKSLRNVVQWFGKLDVSLDTIYQWKYICINLLDNFKETMTWQKRVDINSPFLWRQNAYEHRIEEIFFRMDSGVDEQVFVDQVSISKYATDGYLEDPVYDEINYERPKVEVEEVDVVTPEQETKQENSSSIDSPKTAIPIPTEPIDQDKLIPRIYRNFSCYIDDKLRPGMAISNQLSNWCADNCRQYNPSFLPYVHFDFCFCGSEFPNNQLCYTMCYVSLDIVEKSQYHVCAADRYGDYLRSKITTTERTTTTTPKTTTTTTTASTLPPKPIEKTDNWIPPIFINPRDFGDDTNWIKIVTKPPTTTTTTTTTTMQWMLKPRSTTPPKIGGYLPLPPRRDIVMPALPTKPPTPKIYSTIRPVTTTKYQPPNSDYGKRIINRDKDRSGFNGQPFWQKKEFILISCGLVFILGFIMAIMVVSFARKRAERTRRNQRSSGSGNSNLRGNRGMSLHNNANGSNNNSNNNSENSHQQSNNHQNNGNSNNQNNNNNSNNRRRRNNRNNDTLPQYSEHPPGYNELYPEFVENGEIDEMPPVYGHQLVRAETSVLPRSENNTPEPSAPVML